MDEREGGVSEAVENLRQGIKFPKCHICGCQQGTVKALEKELGKLRVEHSELLKPMLAEAKGTFKPVQYDCLGCKVCFPSLVASGIGKAYPEVSLEESCGSENAPAVERPGWPPFPGDYVSLRYAAPVAVCTLNSPGLMKALAGKNVEGLSMVGTLSTENLGIERLLQNTAANPNIRHLILCGADSKQAIGHMPGASLMALFRNGIDESGKIRGAPGKRPVLKNISRETVARFLRQVSPVDFIGEENQEAILAMIGKLNSSGAEAFQEPLEMGRELPVLQASIKGPLQLDPIGYFVVYVDRRSSKVRAEHFENNGLLNGVVEGTEAAAIYMTLIQNGWVSRLDHAAYLGKELARAQDCLGSGKTYVQDKAQENEADCSRKECC